ncbi:hypothetical protein [uncultured Microscilla sp.]|uniref:antibiotic biosynthesis monooxygenase family protein n=1 Tax=uncultured Microscilla sp. TaxID=432653 RepID=UPI00260DCCAB|nr:hypothetical protein [uncultured Microscilla sp.]
MRILLLLCFMWVHTFTLSAQSDKLTYHLKKGQVFDLLLLRMKPGVQEKTKNYIQTFIPIGKKFGYHSLKGFPVKESPTQGNYHPQSVILAYWDNLALRKKFLAHVEANYPDFHQKRRNIWSRFDLTYYELKKDISFEIYKKKYTVLTAYWQKDTQGFREFKQAWRKKVRQSKGVIKLELTQGISPFGYDYNPDYFTITQWESKAAFEQFYRANLKMNHQAVKQVHQFKIF